MQLAYLQRDNSPECVLALEEYEWLNQTPPPVFPERPRLDPTTAPFHLMYGVFLAQPGMSADQAKGALHKEKGRWLHCLHDGHLEWIALQDVITDFPMTHDHAARVPFAALMQLPDPVLGALSDPNRAVLVSSAPSQVTDPLSTLFTRDGLLALLAQEPPFAPLTKERWGRQVNQSRLRRTADRIR